MPAALFRTDFVQVLPVCMIIWKEKKKEQILSSIYHATGIVNIFNRKFRPNANITIRKENSQFIAWITFAALCLNSLGLSI